MHQIAPRLRRWTAWHADWREEVGSVAVETPDGLVLVDPLDPPDDVARPDHVLITVYWHVRSTAHLANARVWAAGRSARPLENRGVEAVTSLREAERLPGGIEAFETARSGEVVYWLQEQAALVVGDVLLGAGAKPRPTEERLRLCPERWLGKPTHDDLRSSLRPLLDLPVERVLVSHGAPVLSGARDALATVLR